LGLVTLRVKELLGKADVVVFDYLCNPEMLKWAKEGVEIIYAGKKAGNHTLRQEEINALLVEKTKAGHRVLRLKGGDPFLFGRGGEEAEALAEAGLRLAIVPGVTSAIAAPAYAGIPVTHRDFTSSLTIFTGHEDPLKADTALDYARLAALPGTKVMLMGWSGWGRLRRSFKNMECLRTPRWRWCAGVPRDGRTLLPQLWEQSRSASSRRDLRHPPSL
jgi:uroporphyrinogen III methyltransferase/synthase